MDQHLHEKDRVAAIFNILRTCFPEPTTELVYETPFQLLVAVVLSAQATDKGVNKTTAPFFKTIKEAHHLAALSINEIEEAIKSIGLYKAKARYLKELAERLVSEHQGNIPANREQLMQLSGVGRKTANVVLNTLYGLPFIAVDTHVYRVSHRLGFSAGPTPLAVELDLMEVIPPAYLKDAHHHLILHGRYTCKARNPTCQNCAIRSYCPSVQQ